MTYQFRSRKEPFGFKLDFSNELTAAAALPTGSEVEMIQRAIQQGTRDENRLTGMVFDARHPELGGRRLRTDERALVQEWLDIRDRLVRLALKVYFPVPATEALRQGRWIEAIQIAIKNGERDEDQLTNKVFSSRHPERQGKKLVKGEPGFDRLAKEWLDIRNQLVRPALIGFPALHAAQSNTAGGNPAIPAAQPTQAPATLQPVEVNAANCVAQVRAADAAIRRRFGLTGAALIETSINRVRCVPRDRFEMLIPGPAISDILVNAFMEQWLVEPFSQILRFYKRAFVISDDPKFMEARFRKLREFVAERINAGHFQFLSAAGAMNTNAMPVRRVAAAAIGGFTSSEAVRASRRVILPLPSLMEILVHEGCHFYAHPNFDMAARRNNEFFRELRISQVLREGFCEYFARDVMQANQAAFGPIDLWAYERHREFVGYIITTAGGDAVARQAYFAGGAAAINRVMRSAIEASTAYPLVTPPEFL
jgi:hypothetical protein